MQSRVPLINPLELDSPFIQGMGHDMMEEVEKLALEDTNKGTTPIFPMRSGFDSNLIFGIVGKPLPNNLIQWGKAQKGRIPYALKIGQEIGNRLKANVLASIPLVDLSPEKEDGMKISDKIEFQIENSNISAPVESSNGSLLNRLGGYLLFFYRLIFPLNYF